MTDTGDVIRAAQLRYAAEPELWDAEAERNNWHMPLLSRWQRVPVVAHICWLRYAWRLAIRTGFVWDGDVPPGVDYDAWVLWGLEEGLWR